MQRLRRSDLRLIVATIALVLILAGTNGAAAQGSVALVDGEIDGIQLDLWGSGEIAPVEEGQTLRISRITFDPCTAIVLHNTGGSTLIYAESSGIRYAYQGGESVPDEPLEQGEAITLRPTDYLSIVNANVDPAYSVSLLVVSVVEGDSYVEIPQVDDSSFLPEGSACIDIDANGAVVPTILGEGRAGAGADQLYVGSIVFGAGSTTDGWAIVEEAATFNVLLLAGSMSTAGPNSGRGAWIGAGGVISDSLVDGPIVSVPFRNDGATPVLGLVFGTAANGSPVYVSAE